MRWKRETQVEFKETQYLVLTMALILSIDLFCPPSVGLALSYTASLSPPNSDEPTDFAWV